MIILMGLWSEDGTNIFGPQWSRMRA